MSKAADRQTVLDEWTDAETVRAWESWHPKIVVQKQAMTRALLGAAKLGPGMRVLDLAAGTGDPAITIAGVVGVGGHVTALDISGRMLEVCEANARAAGRANMAFVGADAESLPFADETFDRVTSRLGVMYFVDARRALGEVRRVLKPGGAVALAAWGPAEDSPYALCGFGPFMQRLNPPPPPPDAPGPMRYASAGSLSHALRAACFSAVSEEQQLIELAWPGSPEELWRHLYDVAVPMRPLFDGLADAERRQAITEAVAGYAHYDDGEHVRVPAAVVIASAYR